MYQKKVFPKRPCGHCGKIYEPISKVHKFCSRKCIEAAKIKRVQEKREAARPMRPCVNCGVPFKGRPNKNACSIKCATAFNSASRTPVHRRRPRTAMPRTNAVEVTATPGPELIGYILSDVIHSGSIRDELDRLAENRHKAIGALKAKLLADLTTPTWPKDSLGRAALVLFLLSDNPNHGPILHPHEKRVFGYRKPSRLGFRP